MQHPGVYEDIHIPTFIPYITSNTRDNKTLDLFYAPTKEAYHFLPLPSPQEVLITAFSSSACVQAHGKQATICVPHSEEMVSFNTTMWDVLYIKLSQEGY